MRSVAPTRSTPNKAQIKKKKQLGHSEFDRNSTERKLFETGKRSTVIGCKTRTGNVKPCKISPMMGVKTKTGDVKTCKISQMMEVESKTSNVKLVKSHQ